MPKKKPIHMCRGSAMNCCQKADSGVLFLEFKKSFRDIFGYEMKYIESVRYCPFCGYSPLKAKD